MKLLAVWERNYWRLFPHHHTGVFPFAKVKKKPSLKEEDGIDWLKMGKSCFWIHEKAGMSFTFLTGSQSLFQSSTIDSWIDRYVSSRLYSSFHFSVSLRHSLWDPEALASCALMVEVTMATEWSCGPGCTHTRIHSSSLPQSLSVSSCIHIRSYRCPQKYNSSWFWLTHSRGGGSQLVMVLISHNALQPLGTHCARSQLINIHEPSDEYANGEKAAVSRWTTAADRKSVV